MTWRELIEKIPEDKLDTDVTIYDDYMNSYMDRYFPMSNFGWDNPDIGDGSFYISF